MVRWTSQGISDGSTTVWCTEYEVVNCRLWNFILWKDVKTVVLPFVNFWKVIVVSMREDA